MLAALAERLIVSHWRAIDDERRPGGAAVAGRLSPGARAAWTVVTSGLILTCLQYILLTGRLQDAVANQLPEIWRTHIGSDETALWLASYRPLIRNATWALGCAFLYMVLPSVVVTVVFKERLRDHGLSARGFVRHLWIYAVLVVPVVSAVAVVSGSPDFQASYPFYKDFHGMTDLLVWEAFYALQFFALEFFFRGFMLHGVKEKLGSGAILLMVVPYCMIHFQKPILETLGAIVAGLVLGTLALRTRSILGGFVIHVCVAVSMDVAALLRRGAMPW